MNRPMSRQTASFLPVWRAKQGPPTAAAPDSAGASARPPSTPYSPIRSARMRAEDREFLPAALEIYETPPSPIAVSFIWIICALFVAALAWSYFGWMDIHAIASGKTQPSGRSKVVQPLEPGRVAAVLVQNGSRVEAGATLVGVDPSGTAPGPGRQAGGFALGKEEGPGGAGGGAGP